MYQIFLAASIATMGLTPLCRKYADRIVDYIVGMLPHELTRGRGALAKSEKAIAMTDHVIIVGLWGKR